MNILDEFTSVDEEVEGLAVRLDEIGSLLAESSSGDGDYTPTPFEYATLPAGSGRMALPPGKTVINFTRGLVQNEHEGEMYQIRELDDMGSDVDGLGTAFLYADSAVDVEFEGDQKWTLSAGQYTRLKSPGYQSIELEPQQPGMPYTIHGVASTRSSSFVQPDSMNATVSRTGNLDLGTYDSWMPMNWQPYELLEWVQANGDADPWAYSDTEIEVVSTPRKTVQIENASGNGNSIDVRLMASSTPEMDFYEVGRETGIADGDHHVFHVTQQYEHLQTEVRNSTDGSDVASSGQLTGVSN